jgi:cytochrome c oxidase cbb3-type subunit 3
MSNFWSIFITVGTLGSIVWFVYVLMVNRKTSHKPGETTGHNYDGIEELDNPLPSWWFWMFVLLIVYSLGYLLYYPGLGNFKGLSEWTSTVELEADWQANEAKFAPLFARFREIPVAQLPLQPEAMKMGQRLFATNCAVCHGAAATGAAGFPDLTDKAWLWGESGAAIETTIKDGCTAAMPPHEVMFDEAKIADLTGYLLSLNGQQKDLQSVARGKTTYGQICFACHGPEAKGNPLMGAPDLTNQVWLYGDTQTQIQLSIAKGRGGIMPGFDDRLGADKVHILAGYVYGLSHKASEKQ